MKRIVCLIAMLALVAMMTAPGDGLTSAAPGSAADAAGHPLPAAASMADMLADCCSVEDGAMHHAGGGCAMDCSSAVPAVPVSLAMLDAKLAARHSGLTPSGRIHAPFRPPIAV